MDYTNKYNGKPCKRCGNTLRYKSCGSCFICIKMRVRASSESEEQRNKRLNYYRNKNLQYNYGITSERKDEILNNQLSQCAICRSTDPGKKGWHLDHNHTTKQIRGILCGKCNTGLGMFREDVDLMQRAIDYLQRFSSSEN